MGLLAVLVTSPKGCRGIDPVGSSAVVFKAASLRRSVGRGGKDLSSVASDFESKYQIYIPPFLSPTLR